MPNWLAHSIFVDADTQIIELNGGQIDLFYALIYLTSQSYDYDKSTPKTTTFIFKKSKIQNAIKESKTLNDAMEKLDGLEIITNILGSWGDGELDRFKPFVITPIKSRKRVVKFKIEVQEKFIKEFSNPNPKFTLSYEYISAFTNPQAKLLYIILFDHLGMVKENGNPKSRIIDLENLKVLMNRGFDYKTDTLARDIKKSVELINKHTDIKILKHFNEDDEKDENVKNHKFTMIRTKPYQLYEKDVEDSSEPEFTEAIQVEANRRIKQEEAKGTVIKNRTGYFDTTCESIVEEQNQANKYQEEKLLLDNIDIKDFMSMLEQKYNDYVTMKDYKLVYVFDENNNKPLITNNALETVEVLEALE